MNYKIAIPSFRREHTLIKKTLAYLQAAQVEPEDVYVFCADEKEALRYEDAFISSFGHNYRYRIIIGVPTLCGQRNFINQFFAEGTYVLNFDDDVDGLYYARNKKLHLLTELETLLDRGNRLMLRTGIPIFGVYPVANHFFMGEDHTLDLRYIVGCFWGCIIDHSNDLKITIEDKEDFERSILYYKKFGGVIRFNDICVKTNYYKEPGGMQVTRTKLRVTEHAEYLLQKYPEYCKLNESKKNQEFTEIKLIANPQLKGKGIFDGL